MNLSSKCSTLDSLAPSGLNYVQVYEEGGDVLAFPAH